jgi:nitroimidazol reductase NimA-like FMN-containing flavoprotein (pyridoxamine 5'-phosphate oxidase superfamily)
MVLDGRTWMEILSPPRCWELMSAQKVGRIGVLVDSAPEIYPVNYAVDGKTIVFRADVGSKLRGLNRSPAVCFEVDLFDAEQRSGWSVLVKGRARELSTSAEVKGAEALGLQSWAIGRKVHWIRIDPTEVTGRRVEPTDER